MTAVAAPGRPVGLASGLVGGLVGGMAAGMVGGLRRHGGLMPPRAFAAKVPADAAKARGAILDQRATWEDLLAAANAGDGVAFRRFLTDVTPVVRAIVRARGHGLPPDQHEDVIQDVLLALHLKRQTWREDTPVRPWLYAVVRYKVVDACRRRGQAVHLPIEDFADILEGDCGAEPLSARDAARMLAQIDPRSADIVRAISLEGKSPGQVGARLAMSEGAVRVAYHRAMKRLIALGQEQDD